MAFASFIRLAGRFVAGLVLATVVVEAALWLIALTPLWQVLPVVEVSLYGPDPRTGYTHRPNARGIWRTENRAEVEINAQGFRGRSLQEPKPANERRIAVVGDSVVEALQVEEAQTFAALLERRLGSKGQDVRVANFGLAGASVAVQRERVASLVAAHRPDIVVLLPTFSDFFGSQAEDDSAFPAWKPAQGGGLVLAHGFRETAGYRFRTGAIGQAYYWLLDHVQIAGLLNNRKNAGFMPPVQHAPARNLPDDPCRGLAESWARFDEPAGWLRVETYFADIARLGRDQRFTPVIVMRGLGVEPVCESMANPSRKAALQRLSAQAAAHGIALHSMDDRLAALLPAGESPSRTRGFGTRIGFGHLNPYGHQVYAAVLEDIVQATGLVR